MNHDQTGAIEMSVKSGKILYTAEAVVEGGREGHGRTSDGRLDVDLSVPVALGGLGGGGTNPEQLFALGYAACFLSGAARSRVRTQSRRAGFADDFQGGHRADRRGRLHARGLA